MACPEAISPSFEWHHWRLFSDGAMTRAIRKSTEWLSRRGPPGGGVGAPGHDERFKIQGPFGHCTVRQYAPAHMWTVLWAVGRVVGPPELPLRPRSCVCGGSWVVNALCARGSFYNKEGNVTTAEQ